MGQTTLSIRMDEDVKRRFDAFCADVGMNATVAINMFASITLQEKRLPFDIISNKNKESISTQIPTAKDTGWLDTLIGITSQAKLTEEEKTMTDKELLAKWRWEDYENLN